MIQISQLKLPISHTEADLRQKIKKTLRCGETLFSYEIIRQSLDARHKEDKKFVYTVHVKAENEKKILLTLLTRVQQNLIPHQDSQMNPES